MVQKIKPGNIWGRIGTKFAEGIAEEAPKEIERYRLAQGLKNLEQQQGLTPFQQFSRLAATPGITPQMIQSGSELLRQQAMGQALADYAERQNQPKPSPFPEQPKIVTEPGVAPSITQPKPLAEIQEGGIPPTTEEEFARAGQLFRQNPARFANDPQKAIDYVANETIRNQAINQAYQQKHENLSRIQDNVVSRLKAQSERLQTNVPAELYSRIEDEAIQATKSKKEGGEGLTEQQAMKKYGDKLNDASRDWAKIREVGNWAITLRPSSETLRSLKDIQNKMEKYGETDNYAKEMITENKLSPKLSYAIAEPVNKVPELNTFLKTLPELERIETIAESKVPPEVSIPKTLEIAPKLAKFVKDNEKASPLAIAYELEKKGYDPQTWLQYVTDHVDDLNLRQRQSEQAATPINIMTPWNDWWLSSFSGLD